MNLKDLTKPMPYRWKIQNFTKTGDKAQCVAYIDSRDAQNLLDEVVGPENWQDSYRFDNGKLIAGVGILCSSTVNMGDGMGAVVSDKWVWKYDTGTESAVEEDKGQFSDAFKRACVKWGVGRFLYDLDIKWIPVRDRKPVDPTGKIIYDLTAFFNGQLPVTTDEMFDTFFPDEPVKEYSPAVAASKAAFENPAGLSNACALCGGDLILKEGKYGPFYACANYPNCRHTVKVVDYNQGAR